MDGERLLYELDSERRKDGTRQRPIIFIAHDVGGIVVKIALTHSDPLGQSFFEWHNIKPSTYGIIFMGVRQQDEAEILLRIAKTQGRTSDNPLRYLEDSSESLIQYALEIRSISRDFEIKFAYETYPTPNFAGKAIEVS